MEMSAQSANVLGFMGNIVSGIGGVISAKQETDTGAYNAAVLQQRAEAERRSQTLLEAQKRKIIEANLGTQVALYAKSGIKMTGSPLDVMLDSLTNAEMDIAIDRYNSEVAARGYETEAQITRMEAKQRASLGYLKTGGTFLSDTASFLKSQQEIGTRGQTLGAGTTSYGIKVPSRYIPAR